MKQVQDRHKRMAVLAIALLLVGGYASAAKAQTATELSDEQLANIVRYALRSEGRFLHTQR